MHEMLIIIGASGHGKVVADIAVKMNRWKEIVFLDDNQSIKKHLGFDVVGNTNDTNEYKERADFFVAIGDNSIRENIQERLMNNRFSIATLIHPDAVIAIDVEIGIGTAVMAGVVINTSTRIGDGCIINTSSSIDHDNMIKDFVHISPGVKLAGTVSIGTGTWLGIGSIVINNISIIERSLIGAGSLVIEDINTPGTYMGSPVRRKY